MKIKLTRIDSSAVRGIYGRGEDTLPDRMRWLNPEAAASSLWKAGRVPTLTDMFRSPEASLAARRRKRGVQPPGFSAHNFGLAADLHVDETIRSFGDDVKTKRDLDAYMESHGWYCHRLDGRRGHEDWHYNYLGRNARKRFPAGLKRTSGLVEQKILRLHGGAFRAVQRDPHLIQELLQGLRMYRGAVDGDVGPLTREAVRVFRRAWGLPDDGIIDERFARVLAVVTMTVHEVPCE